MPLVFVSRVSLDERQRAPGLETTFVNVSE
jgi:hypothetical protein